MSFVEKYLKGWQFRTSTPTLTPDDEVVVTVTGYDDEEGSAVARIGDTKLYIEDSDGADVGNRVRVRVLDFDDAINVGHGEALAVVGRSGF